MRVFGRKTHMRNESDRWEAASPLRGSTAAPSTGRSSERTALEHT